LLPQTDREDDSGNVWTNPWTRHHTYWQQQHQQTAAGFNALKSTGSEKKGFAQTVSLFLHFLKGGSVSCITS
jgi:hypothetical protein